MTSMTDLDLHPAFESTEPLIQCEIVTPAASQPSDSVTNLRFLSENIDQHAFSGQLPSSFSENMPPLRENTSHSSSYRESHTNMPKELDIHWKELTLAQFYRQILF